MSRRPQHLQRRSGTFYFRFRVPADLQPILGRREYHHSLKTSDLSEAKQLVLIERMKVQAEIDTARRQLETRLREQGHEREITSLTDAQVWSLATRWFVQAEARAETLSGAEVDIETRLEDFAYLSDRHETSSSAASIHNRTEKFLKEQGLKLDPQSSSFIRLSRMIRDASLEHEKRLLNRFAHQNFVLDGRFTDLTARTELHPGATLTLSELIKRYRADRTKGIHSPKTILKQRAQDRLMKEVLGPKTLVSEIDREKARKFLNVVCSLPPNWTKRFKNLSVTKVLSLDATTVGKPMSPLTSNSYLAAFTSLMEFAVNEHLIDRNPARGLRLPSDGIRAKDRRSPFSDGDLRAIFSAPIYTGCLDDEQGYAKSGPNIPRRGRFWIPLIALFSGMRLNEICQLTEDDIAIEDRTDVILVRSDEDGTKRVKTAAGERYVPIHPDLKRVGFLDFVASVRRSGQPRCRLFPELKVASTGYASDNFSKWFARFLDSRGIKDRRKTFHSFRHSFRDALDVADTSKQRIRALGGWSSGHIEDSYGSDLRASILEKEISKIRYPELDLRHLWIG